MKLSFASRLRSFADCIFSSLFTPAPRHRRQLGAIDLGESVAAELGRIKGDVNAALQAQKGRIGELGKEQGQLQAQLFELQQKAARRGGDGGDGIGTDASALRSMLEESAELAAVANGKARRAVIDLPSAAITSGNGLGWPATLPGAVRPPERRFTIRSLIPSVPTTAGAVQYVQETSFTNAAAPVSEGSLKPETTFGFTPMTSNIATIAHWTKCSTQVLSDAPFLGSYIASRLRYGLDYAIEVQLLRGSGIGNNLRGLLTSATAFNRVVALDTKLDALRRAMTELEEAELSPSGIVLAPRDWEAICLQKNSLGDYTIDAPSDGTPPRLWGLPIVSTAAMNVGSFLVADFPAAAIVLDREAARLDISTEDQDSFVRNMAVLRSEVRLGLCTLRPLALVAGTFAA